MDSRRWQRVERLFEAAVELPLEQRAAYLGEACSDGGIRLEVEQLLAADAAADGFLEAPALAGIDTAALGWLAADEGSPERLTDRRPGALAPGAVLAGRFRIVRFIAAGGMGEVYEADDFELGERIAIKTIRPEIAEDDAAMARFRREVQLARQVTHPSVCRCYDLSYHQPEPSGADDPAALAFLTMELLGGETLSRRLKDEGAMTPEQALPIVEQVAAALTAAHDRGIVHRDLHPAPCGSGTMPGNRSGIMGRTRDTSSTLPTDRPVWPGRRLRAQQHLLRSPGTITSA